MNTAVAHDEQMALARRGYQVGQVGQVGQVVRWSGGQVVREQHQPLSRKEPSR